MSAIVLSVVLLKRILLAKQMSPKEICDVKVLHFQFQLPAVYSENFGNKSIIFSEELKLEMRYFDNGKNLDLIQQHILKKKLIIFPLQINHIPPVEFTKYVNCPDPHGNLEDYKDVDTGYEHSDNVQITLVRQKVAVEFSP